MKVNIQRSTLLKPIQMISGVVERRQTMPILANVLITAKDNQLSLTATDLEIEIIGTLTEEVEMPGAITVSAKKLLDICRTLPDDARLQCTLEGDHFILRSQKSRFVLTTMPVTDFPNIENSPFTHEFTISQANLKNLLSKTHFAMGQQDVRYYLNGALLVIEQKQIKCVATDGHRLAVTSIQSEQHDENSALRMILPRKSVLELMRLLDANDTRDVKMCIGENHFRIIAPEFTFTSKLINTQFPQYEKLIPANVHNSLVADREALKQALVRASILCNEKFRGVRLHLDQGTLRIVANNPEQEEAEEVIHLTYEGNAMEFGFNANYLLDVVSTMTADKIRWSFTDPSGGIIIEAAENGVDDSLYVVMPMRL